MNATANTSQRLTGSNFARSISMGADAAVATMPPSYITSPTNASAVRSRKTLKHYAIAAIEGAELKLSRIVELPPYHYGAVFERVSME